jgi:hypothetical protein
MLVNLDKRERVSAYGLGTGESSYELHIFGSISTALPVLLSVSSGRGLGDYPNDKGAGAMLAFLTNHFAEEEGLGAPTVRESDANRANLVLSDDPVYGIGEVLNLNDVVGRWGGDRIAIIGDHCESGDLPGFTDQRYPAVEESDGEMWEPDFYYYARENYTDITPMVRVALANIFELEYPYRNHSFGVRYKDEADEDA